VSQSNVIFGMILIAFVVFITTRGELPSYLSLLRGGTATGSSGAGVAVGQAIAVLPALNGLAPLTPSTAGSGAPAGSITFDPDNPFPDQTVDYGFGDTPGAFF
jgi:hypothetical protein